MLFYSSAQKTLLMAGTIPPVMQLGPSFCRVTPSLRQSHGNDSASQVAPQGIDRSDISFTDEVFLLPVLKRKKKSHLHQKAIVLKKTNKLTNKTPLNDLIKSWGFFNPQSQNFLTSHSKMPRIRQCYFSQFTHKQWSTGLKKLLSWFKAASVHCSLLDFEDTIPNHTNSWFTLHDFFRLTEDPTQTRSRMQMF